MMDDRAVLGIAALVGFALLLFLLERAFSAGFRIVGEEVPGK